MILSLCLLLPALSPSSQEFCSAPGALPAPTLYLSQTSSQPGDSVWLKCFVFSQLLATRIVFCKDGEKVSSQRGFEKKAIYGYSHVVSGVSSGNYTCGYEIKDSDNRVTRSQLSPAQHLSVTGGTDQIQPGAAPAPTAASLGCTDFTHANIARLGLSATVLLILGLILAEAYYSHPKGAP